MQSMVYLKDVVTLSYKQEMCNGCGISLTDCTRKVLRRSNRKDDIAKRYACIESDA